MTLYRRQQKRHRYKEQTFGLCGRRWGWVDLREQHWNMYITYVKWIISPSSMHETGHSKPVQWNNPDGWDGEGGGRGVQDRGHLYTYGWFMSVMAKPPQYCKVSSLQLKLINFLKSTLWMKDLVSNFQEHLYPTPNLDHRERKAHREKKDILNKQIDYYMAKKKVRQF